MKQSLWLKSAALVALAPAVIVLYLALGAVSLPIGEVIAASKIMLFQGSEAAREVYPKTTAILFHIRLPRALAAILAGSALAMAGAAMQGLFRNPLASPNVLGVSAGSGFGAVVAITTGLSMLHPLWVPGLSILGALATAGVVYSLAMRIQGTGQLLFVILTGLAMSSLLAGATSALLMFAAQYEISQYVFWTMGGLEGRMWQHSLWPLPIIVACTFWMLRYRMALNLMSLGDENAHGMGINVPRARKMVLALASILTAMAISIAGPLGFVGLMVPHLVRILAGPNHKRLIPLSAYVGALFVLSADLVGRNLFAPYEIKVGVITAILGGSYFIYLIIRYQRTGRLA